MSMFRSAADRAIDRAHNAIACAEMAINHSFTDTDKARAGAELFQAQRFLARAVAAKKAWNAAPELHSDDDVYPDVPETDDIGMTLPVDGRVYMHGHRDN